MSTTQLTRSMTSTGNRKTATFSSWVKKCNPTKDTQTQISFGGTHNIYLHNAGFRWNDGTGNYLYSNAKQRDTSGWYHLVVAIDTTQSTDTDRVKLYINGEELTLSATTYPTLNEDLLMNVSGTDIFIGNDDSGTGYFDGAMSHVYWIDGTAYAPTVFGSTDATSGEWVINTSPSVTYGTNGFLIMKDGNTITDQGSNSNDFTLGAGTLTDLQDCPDDVFATLNPLDNYYAGSTFSNGNTSQTSHAGAYAWVPSTLGMTKGKFYAECKQTGYSGGSNYDLIGIAGSQNDADTHHLGQIAYTAGYYGQGGVYNQSGSTTSTYASYTTNDIIGVAVDLDNNKLYFSKNGVWQNSGDPTSGATGTGALSITAPSAMTGTTSTGVYRFASGDYGNTVVVNNSWNFGNGYFGTTAISSEGTNASGIGKFEYDVPTGYTALSLKGLQE
jgi:hypothetical protein